MTTNKPTFPCPNCLVHSTFNVEIGIWLNELKTTPDWLYQVRRCDACRKLTFKVIKHERLRNPIGPLSAKDTELFQYPIATVGLPTYIPEKIRRYYKEAVEAKSFNLPNAASMMCRKTIYELIDQKQVVGDNYEDKIRNLGLDKRITDPLLNIKNIGDDSAHATGWDDKTIEKAIVALRIIIDMIYIQEERVKAFSKHYSKTNQTRKRKTEEAEKLVS